MHLISPARSTPLGSERSHFAHSPHLLAALILLIPPEIGGELKRKARSRGCGLGFCALGPPGRRRAGPLAGSRLPASGRQWGPCSARSRRTGRFAPFQGVRGAGCFGGGCQAEPTLPRFGVPRPGRGLCRTHQGAGRWGRRAGEAAAPTPRGPADGRAGGRADARSRGARGPAARVQAPHPAWARRRVRADEVSLSNAFLPTRFTICEPVFNLIKIIQLVTNKEEAVLVAGSGKRPR